MIYIIIALLSAFFLFASSIKIFGWHKKIFETQMEMMRGYGLSREQFRAIGLIELIGVILLWGTHSVVNLLGVILLAGVSMGAIIFHLRYDTWQQGIPAMVTLLLSLMVFLLQSDRLLSFIST